MLAKGAVYLPPLAVRQRDALHHEIRVGRCGMASDHQWDERLPRTAVVGRVDGNATRQALPVVADNVGRDGQAWWPAEGRLQRTHSTPRL
jgi:hypothetical protein